MKPKHVPARALGHTLGRALARLSPRPSLVRRITLTLLGAFALVWAVLLARDYLLFQNQLDQRESLQIVAHALAASLDPADPVLAGRIAQASETQTNRLRQHGIKPYPGNLLLRLETASGTPVYASAPARGTHIPPGEPGPEQVNIGARTYWSASVHTPHWRVQILEPALDQGRVLALLNAELLPYLLIALPLVALPIWLAVRRGLLPLRRLADAVATRAPDDFSPLKQRSRHAELRPLISAFNALFAHARTGIARERALVQDAAHELRTPLAVIAAQAHVLAHAETPEHTRQAQAALEHAVTRASHLVQQLLTLARLENTEPRPTQRTDLIATTRLLMISATPAATEKNIDLALDSPEQLWATLDVSAFHSVLENLLANAIAHCPQDSEVRVTLHEHDESLCLAVADNGPGIPPEEWPHLFERFRRGRQTQSSGSGLGLAIVRQATERLNGVIKTGPGLLGRGMGLEVHWKNISANDRPRMTH